MTTDTTERTPVETLEIRKEIEIATPVEIAFEALLEELGPGSELPDGRPFPMKIEPWPGGRWYRDLGNNSGHFWGHVQVIKPPALLELCGPMPMSYPAINHVQYRLKAEGDRTRLTLLHRAMGLIPPEHRDGMPDGWEHGLKRIRELAERKNRKGGTAISACCDAASDRKAHLKTTVCFATQRRRTREFSKRSVNGESNRCNSDGA